MDIYIFFCQSCQMGGGEMKIWIFGPIFLGGPIIFWQVFANTFSFLAKLNMSPPPSCLLRNIRFNHHVCLTPPPVTPVITFWLTTPTPIPPLKVTSFLNDPLFVECWCGHFNICKNIKCFSNPIIFYYHPKSPI